MSDGSTLRQSWYTALDNAETHFRQLLSTPHSDWRRLQNPAADAAAKQKGKARLSAVPELADVVIHRKTAKSSEDVYRLILDVPAGEDHPPLDSWKAVLATPETRREWDPAVEDAHLVELFDMNTRIVKTNYSLGWPANPRDSVTISRSHYDTTTLVDISTSLPRSPDEPAYLRPSPPSVRSHVNLFAWCIQYSPPAADAKKPVGRLRLTCFWQHDLKELWGFGSSQSTLVGQLSTMTLGLFKCVIKRGSRVPKIAGYGNGVSVERVRYQMDREALTVDYAIIPDDDDHHHHHQHTAQGRGVDDLQAVREQRRLTRSLECLLPALDGWEVQVSLRGSSADVESLPWSANALRTSSSSSSSPLNPDQILLRLTHSALTDNDAVLKVRLVIEASGGTRGLRLNGLAQTIHDFEERDPSSYSMPQRILQDMASAVDLSFATSSSVGTGISSTTSTSSVSTGGGSLGSTIVPPSHSRIPLERTPGAERSILSKVRRNYIYFSSLLQEPEAKWKQTTENRGVSITQLDSIDPTLVVYRAEATFVGVRLWDLYSAVVSPGARVYWDRQHEDATLLEDVNELTELWHYKTKPAWPVNGRDSVVLKTVYKSPTTIHVFSFSVDHATDAHLFPNNVIPAPGGVSSSSNPPNPSSSATNTIRTQIDLQGWAIEALSPNTTSLTLLEQSDPKGWSSKTTTVPNQMIMTLAGIGDYVIKCGGPPVVTRLKGAKKESVRYDHEKGCLKVEYVPFSGKTSLSTTGPGGEDSVDTNVSTSSKADSSDPFPTIECEIRCDPETWGASLDIVVDPPPQSTSCLKRHRLSSEGGGLWITLTHDGVFLEEDERVKVTVRRAPGMGAFSPASSSSTNASVGGVTSPTGPDATSSTPERSNSKREGHRGLVMVNGVRVPVDLEELSEADIKALKEQKRTKPARVPLDQPPAAGVIKRRRAEMADAGGTGTPGPVVTSMSDGGGPGSLSRAGSSTGTTDENSATSGAATVSTGSTPVNSPEVTAPSSTPSSSSTTQNTLWASAPRTSSPLARFWTYAIDQATSTTQSTLAAITPNSSSIASPSSSEGGGTVAALDSTKLPMQYALEALARAQEFYAAGGATGGLSSTSSSTPATISTSGAAVAGLGVPPSSGSVSSGVMSPATGAASSSTTALSPSSVPGSTTGNPSPSASGTGATGAIGEGWTLISDKNGFLIKRKLVPEISPLVPLHVGTKVIQGISAEELAGVVLEPECRIAWDDRFVPGSSFGTSGGGGTRVLEVYSGGAQTSFYVVKAQFPLRDRGFWLATVVGRGAATGRAAGSGISPAPSRSVSTNLDPESTGASTNPTGSSTASTPGGSNSQPPISPILPSSSSSSSARSAIYIVSASFSNLSSAAQSFSTQKLNPYSLPIGRVYMDAWILETLDPYSKENYTIPSTKCTRLVSVDYAGSIPAAFNGMVCGAWVRDVEAIEAYIKQERDKGKAGVLRGSIPITRSPSLGYVVGGAGYLSPPTLSASSSSSSTAGSSFKNNSARWSRSLASAGSTGSEVVAAPFMAWKLRKRDENRAWVEARFEAEKRVYKSLVLVSIGHHRQQPPAQDISSSVDPSSDNAGHRRAASGSLGGEDTMATPRPSRLLASPSPSRRQPREGSIKEEPRPSSTPLKVPGLPSTPPSEGTVPGLPISMPGTMRAASPRDIPGIPMLSSSPPGAGLSTSTLPRGVRQRALSSGPMMMNNSVLHVTSNIETNMARYYDHQQQNSHSHQQRQLSSSTSTSPSHAEGGYIRGRTRTTTSTGAFTERGEVRAVSDLVVMEVVVDSRMYPKDGSSGERGNGVGYAVDVRAWKHRGGAGKDKDKAPVFLGGPDGKSTAPSSVPSSSTSTSTTAAAAASTAKGSVSSPTPPNYPPADDLLDMPFTYTVYTMSSSPLHSSSLTSETPSRHLIRLTLPTAQFQISTVKDPLTGAIQSAPPKPVWMEELERGVFVEMVVRPGSSSTSSSGSGSTPSGPGMIGTTTTTAAPLLKYKGKREDSKTVTPVVVFNGQTQVKVMGEKESLTTLGRDELMDDRVGKMGVLSRIPNESEPLPEELTKPIAVAADLVLLPEVPVPAATTTTSTNTGTASSSNDGVNMPRDKMPGTGSGTQSKPSDGTSVKTSTAEGTAAGAAGTMRLGEDSPNVQGRANGGGADQPHVNHVASSGPGWLLQFLQTPFANAGKKQSGSVAGGDKAEGDAGSRGGGAGGDTVVVPSGNATEDAKLPESGLAESKEKGAEGTTGGGDGGTDSHGGAGVGEPGGQDVRVAVAVGGRAKHGLLEMVLVGVICFLLGSLVRSLVSPGEYVHVDGPSGGSWVEVKGLVSVKYVLGGWDLQVAAVRRH